MAVTLRAVYVLLMLISYEISDRRNDGETIFTSTSCRRSRSFGRGSAGNRLSPCLRDFVRVCALAKVEKTRILELEHMGYFLKPPRAHYEGAQS